ncbi:Fe-S protein assembly co-chaperone HscB [Neptuniibacter sp. CAU 1671]|uniref:Fe-S protein assembly co-chaperone HscB n=1 Tax=Neptuniibacter sp. CAU 1671 TaxID=3032593 RepID=UPI0023DCC941|nr:Fe-S protein assembly co-chaperone HscB [Neptuniibacter sp. CAU 1671]MDF2181924.1 Fe-S protein assembly co-chaperone HscB [Neptuniibacter sp. CAU 1671]
MDIKKNYFEFIGLPVSYHIDLNRLSEQARELQKTLHPDRYAHLSDQEQRRAVQYMAHLNEGVATLKSPLRRAQYLLALQGIDTHNESSTPIDPMFLMQQMELREQLESVVDAADPYAELDALTAAVESELQALRADFAQQFETEQLDQATSTVRKMQFIEKLASEIERLEDRLDD